jgi:hypothetical protein
MLHAALIDAGQTDHHTIDRLLPSQEEKDGLRQLAPAIPDFTDSSIRVQVSSANVSAPPTDAELDTAFGTPAAVGAGFLALLDDNAAGSAVYLIASDGTNWWHVALTKCT